MYDEMMLRINKKFSKKVDSSINEIKDVDREHFDLVKYLYVDFSKIKSKTDFILSASRIHGAQYDYSKTKFVDIYTNVTVTCPKHGDFVVNPIFFLTSFFSGCPKCNKSKNSLSIEDAIFEILDIYGAKWYFINSVYKGSSKDFSIICPKHGVITHKYKNYVYSYRRTCCNKCENENGKDNKSKLEKITANVLEKYGIPYECEKSFESLKDKKALRFDFYIKSLNLLIELDGEQHFHAVDQFGGEEGFEVLKKHDAMKNEFCNENGFNLLRIPYYENVESVLNYVILDPLRSKKLI